MWFVSFWLPLKGFALGFVYVLKLTKFLTKPTNQPDAVVLRVIPLAPLSQTLALPGCVIINLGEILGKQLKAIKRFVCLISNASRLTHSLAPAPAPRHPLQAASLVFRKKRLCAS